MNKKLTLSLTALLIMVGCSKQPSLENVQEVNETKPVTKVQEVNNSVKKVKEANVSVSTENAEVQTQTIEEEPNTQISMENNNQDFAKEISSIVIYFDFDKYNIRPDQWPKVEKLAKLIKENNKNYTIRIEGNCDEWGTEEYNYALGLKRANSVKNALIKLGVDPKKLTIISYGELNPVCTAHARWCWRLNRRDNFTYLP